MSDATTPMLEQYRRLKAQHPDKVLLFRLGDFYELFYEDAEQISRVLELTLTSRPNRYGRVPMCGIPVHAAESYIARLIEKGYKVAVCEQVEDPRTARGLVRREVVRIITPGTVVEGHLLDERRPNHLVALLPARRGPRQQAFGLAWVDVSTGHFAVTDADGPHAAQQALDELDRLRPAELVLPAGGLRDHALTARVRALGAVETELPAAAWSDEAAEEELRQQFGLGADARFGLDRAPLGRRAAGALLRYLRETQLGALGQLRRIEVYRLDERMLLDAATRRNLELTERLADAGRRGTLLEVLDLTETAMGGRLLRDWLERPLTDRRAIEQRLEAVAALVRDPALRAELKALLGRLFDLERLAARVAHGSAGPRELAALRASLEPLPELVRIAGRVAALEPFAAGLDPLEDVCALLRAALVDEPPVTAGEGGLIRDGYHAEVDQLRAAARDGKRWLAELEARERERTGIKSLKVGFNRVFGYYIEVTHPNRHLVPPDYERRQTLAGVERFVTPELKELEAKILGAEERLAALEYELFAQLRRQVAAEVERLQATARAVAALDVLAAFAEAAARYDYVRPRLTDGEELRIRAGRHPVLERAVEPGRFVPNDTLLDGRRRVLLVTGPNMGGKSTYLRQVALIVLMAQAGSFVPAAEAVLPVCDRVFTRIGAGDDLTRGQSTFMVELLQTAHALTHATRRSLIVLDEIGRGTSTYDGMAIARAVIEYIHDRLGAMALVSTHYHELTRLAATRPGIVNLHAKVLERGEDVVFLYQIVPGAADRSYGLAVARLAGLPAEVIERAREILRDFEERERRDGQLMLPLPIPAPAGATSADGEGTSGGAPGPGEHLLRQVADLDVLRMSPLEALNWLYEFQRDVRRALAAGAGEEAGR